MYTLHLLAIISKLKLVDHTTDIRCEKLKDVQIERNHTKHLTYPSHVATSVAI